MIDATVGMPNRGSYRARFGGVLKAAQAAAIPMAPTTAASKENTSMR